MTGKAKSDAKSDDSKTGEPNDGNANKAPGADQGPEQEGGPHIGQMPNPTEGTDGSK